MHRQIDSTWKSGVDKNSLQSTVVLIESEVLFSVLLGSIREVPSLEEFILYSLQSAE